MRIASVESPDEDVPSGWRRFTFWASVAASVFLAAMVSRQGESPAQPPSASPAAAAAQPIEAAPRDAPGESPSAGTRDHEMRSEIERLIFLSQPLRDATVSVQVVNSIATLTGEVPSATAGQLAVGLARSVPGVRQVFDVTTLRATAPPEPAAAPRGAAPADAAAADAASTTPVAPAAMPSPAVDRERVRQLLDQARREIDAGNHQAAANILESVLKLDPTNPHAQEALRRWREHGPPPPRPPRR